MSKAEDKAIQYCCTKCANNKLNCGMKLMSHGRNCVKCSNYIEGYHQAEKDLTNKAKFSSGWDGFFYGQGYKQAEKDFELTWEDIHKIGNLFNECMSKLEKENSGYADYGVPSKVLAQEVLKAFYEQKQQ